MNTLEAVELGDRTTTIASLVHDYLVRNALTDGELAELVGVHQTQISRWKRGTGVPRASQVAALAEILDLSEDVVEEARVESEKLREELVAKKEQSPKEELKRMRDELRKAQARIKRLEERLRRIDG